MRKDIRFALFELGIDDRHISTVDPAGIALLAVQELLKKIEVLEAKVEELSNILGQ